MNKVWTKGLSPYFYIDHRRWSKRCSPQEGQSFIFKKQTRITGITYLSDNHLGSFVSQSNGYKQRVYLQQVPQQPYNRDSIYFLKGIQTWDAVESYHAVHQTAGPSSVFFTAKFLRFNVFNPYYVAQMLMLMHFTYFATS